MTPAEIARAVAAFGLLCVAGCTRFDGQRYERDKHGNCFLVHEVSDWPTHLITMRPAPTEKCSAILKEQADGQ